MYNVYQYNLTKDKNIKIYHLYTQTESTSSIQKLTTIEAP